MCERKIEILNIKYMHWTNTLEAQGLRSEEQTRYTVLWHNLNIYIYIFRTKGVIMSSTAFSFLRVDNIFLV